MSASGDDYGKKFQLTDSLLKRVLQREEYDGIKTVEPVFVYTDEPNCKQLKGPGYKHAVVSTNFIYIVNTPAKQDSDLVFSVSLEEVENLEIIYDTADFLQGDLRKTSQHVQLSCKKHLSTTKHLLFKAASLAFLSSDDLQEHKLKSSRNSSNLSLSIIDDTQESVIRNCKSLHTSPTSSSTEADLKFQLRRDSEPSKQSKQTANEGKSSRRPLPKPLVGTEMLNASYTSSTLTASLKRGKNKKKTSERRSSKLSLGSTDIQTILLHKKPLSKSQKEYLLSSSLNQSWNDVLRTEQHSSAKLKHPVIQSLMLSETQSGSLGKIHSSNLSRSFTENKHNDSIDLNITPLTTRESNFSKGESTSKLSSSSDATVNKEPLLSLEKFEVHLFTVAPGSKLFNMIEQSWIYSLLENTVKIGSSLFESNFSIPSQHKNGSSDEMVQKFTQLKEEIILSESEDELFMLTKELKHASEKYLLVRKSIWKSTSLLNFFMTKLKHLIESRCTNMNARMDELDLAILIGEFWVSIFQDSEMFSGRQMLLNENRAKFVKDLSNVVLATPKMKFNSKETANEELLELVTNWNEISIALLFEVINATKQNVWSCFVATKSLDIVLLSHHFESVEPLMKNLMDHLVLNLTAKLTSNAFNNNNNGERSTTAHPSSSVLLTPASLITVYKSIVVLHFVCAHCPKVLDHVKTFYHEEIKYYISKADNWDRLPTNIPVVCLIKSVLPDFLRAIT